MSVPDLCPCRGGVDGFCHYGAQVPGCAMTWPGGTCDPDGDGDLADADWSRGSVDYQSRCALQPPAS